MKRLAIVSILLTAVLGMSGCATPLGQKLNSVAAERIDLGDGLVFDAVPVKSASSATDKVIPGSGKLIDEIERALAAKREAKLGPFGGLPFTITRTVLLKNGGIITEAEIDKIIRTRTPITPAPITDVIEPSDYGTVPVPGATVPTNYQPAAPSSPPAPVVEQPAAPPAPPVEPQAQLKIKGVSGRNLRFSFTGWESWPVDRSGEKHIVGQLMMQSSQMRNAAFVDSISTLNIESGSKLLDNAFGQGEHSMNVAEGESVRVWIRNGNRTSNVVEWTWPLPST